MTVGGGNNLIAGNGGQDILMAGKGNNQLYAGKQSDLATALAQQKNQVASGRNNMYGKEVLFDRMNNAAANDLEWRMTA